MPGAELTVAEGPGVRGLRTLPLMEHFASERDCVAPVLRESTFFFFCFPLSPSDMLVKTEIFLLTFRAADGFVRV